MVNIVHCRIDDRLIHGQVATSWIPHTKANLVLIANDNIAGTPTLQELQAMSAPAGIQLRFFTIDKTIEVIGKAAPHQQIFLLLESVSDAAKLVMGGVPVESINLGNMRSKTGKEALTRTFYVDLEEKKLLASIVKSGVKVNYRLLPTDKAQDLSWGSL